ncbi:GumC family protein [Acidobacteriota bacterium]
MLPKKKTFENPVEQYLRIVLKRKWLLIFSFVVCLGVSAFYNFSLTPMYRSSAKILIELDMPRYVQDQGYAQVVTADYYLTQFEILKSRPILTKVIEKLNLAETFQPPKTLKQKILERFKLGPPHKRPNYTVASLYPTVKGSIGISPITKAGLVNISVHGPEAKQCQDIANALVDVFIVEMMESKVRSIFSASDYLQNQLSKLNLKIQQAETSLESFEKKEGLTGIIGRRKDVDTERYDQLLNSYMESKQKRWELEARIQSIRQIINRGDFVGLTLPSFQNEALSAMSAELLQNEQKLAKLQQQDYKEKHPLIVETKAAIRFNKQQLAHEARKWLAGMETEIAVLRNQEKNLYSMIQENQDEYSGSVKRSAEHEFLTREVMIQKNLYSTYDEQLKKLQLIQDVHSNNIRVIEPARQPRTPYSPNTKLNLLLGAIVGLSLGFTLVFLKEYLDNTIKTKDDVENFLEIPMLGTIPIMSAKIRPSTLITARSDPGDIMTDAYRTLRTNLQFFQGEQKHKSFVVTSAGPSEGKSTTVANLALTLVHMGKKVLLVDTDLRKPMLHKTFKINNDFGVTSLFAGIKDKQKLIQPTRAKNLMIFPSGPIPPNPTEILASTTFRHVVENLKSNFDYVLFDSPPILAVADASILASLTDGTVLVINSGQATIKICQLAIDQLTQAKCVIIGCVLNRFDYRESGYYSYYNKYYRYGYGYGYGSKSGKDAGTQGGKIKSRTASADPGTRQ